MNIADVFENTREDGKFSLHMSNFGHVFLHEADIALVCGEPPFFAEISKNAYVFAAGFVHYWCDIFMLDVPGWVHGAQYRHETPYFPQPATQPAMQEYIRKLTPDQFAARNYFILASEVIYV